VFKRNVLPIVVVMIAIGVAVWYFLDIASTAEKTSRINTIQAVIQNSFNAPYLIGDGELFVDEAPIMQNTVNVERGKTYFVHVDESNFLDGTLMRMVIMWPNKTDVYYVHVGSYINDSGKEVSLLPGYFGVRYKIPQDAACKAVVFYNTGNTPMLVAHSEQDTTIPETISVFANPYDESTAICR
jgi:hypothetical protein